MTFAAFETHEVTESGIEMPGAGGGFHKSLAVDELELNHGDVVTLAVEVRVTKVRFDPVDPKAADSEDYDPDDGGDGVGPLRRVHVLKVIGAAQIDTTEMRRALDAQAARVAEAEAAEKARREAEKAAAKGQLPLGSPEAEGAPGELCAHDLDPGECTDCVPLPLEPEPGAAEARNGLHAVQG